MILRCRFTKLGDIAYISHLDLLKVFIRALRRTNIEVYYSEGFHPHPKISSSSALSLGIQSYAEFMDIDIKNEDDRVDFVKKMNESLPEGIDIVKCTVIEKSEPLTKLMSHSLYEFYFDIETAGVLEIIKDVMSKDEFITKKKNKKKQIKDINIREKIYSLEFDINENKLKAILMNSPEGALKPTDMLKAINQRYEKSISPYKIVKIDSMMVIENVINKI